MDTVQFLKLGKLRRKLAPVSSSRVLGSLNLENNLMVEIKGLSLYFMFLNVKKKGCVRRSFVVNELKAVVNLM